MSEKSSHNHATDRLRESLSVTLDGQASELELRRVLDGIGYDDELRSTARRYQLIGDVLRGEANEFSSVDLTAGVMSAIEQEETGKNSSSSQQESAHVYNRQPDAKTGFGAAVQAIDNLWSSLGRVAVAATVAFTVVLGVRNFNTPQEFQTVAVNEPLTMNQPVQLGTGNAFGASGIRAGYGSKQHDSITPEQLAYAQSVADRATKERFRAYALQHAELSAMNTGQGILAFARLTSFDQ